MTVQAQAQFLDYQQFSKSPSNAQLAGIAVLQGVTKALAKNGREYLRCSLVLAPSGDIESSVTISGISFSDTVVSSVTEEHNGCVVLVSGSINEYNGSRSLKIDAVSVADQSLKSQILASPYNSQEMITEFVTYVKDRVSPEAFQVFSLLLQPVVTQFTQEYAALASGTHHDNVLGGLLAHSYKVLKLMGNSLDTYAGIAKHVNHDILLVGVALHDIGKVVEYAEGEMSSVGKLLSHRTHASLMLSKIEAQVVELMGEEWYYRLHSVFQQHHGEWEESPRTVEAYLVHLVDSFEAQMCDAEFALPLERKAGTASRLSDVSASDFNTFRLGGFFLS